MADTNEAISMGDIAIIGMNGRFPGAKNTDEFWDNLANGVESVRFFDRDQLLAMGVEPQLLDNPKFVAADAILDDMDLFDASFFDYSAREAEIMDPQHRLFLESAWEVMESAGYCADAYDGKIAVFAGANLSGYMIRNLYGNPGLVNNIGTFKIMIANGQDFLATKVSYKMGFTGSSVNVNTLCSSSMVALHYACQELLNYGCDIALAGGVSFQVSRNEAFFYQEGGIGSSDGHCRAFDAKANGTVSGSGLAVVALKRLEEAIEDGDQIYAVVKGTGINNDGSMKNSFTAPNVDGQAECIAQAIAMSGVHPETISYIDAHGTGTDLGDPIEIAALTKAYRAYTQKTQYCAIGSVKTNIGHLVNAGGMASLIKVVLAMNHQLIPPSLNFELPNPKIDFINSPFYVNTKPAKWEAHKAYPRRAGVSSFGIGGTNTHVIVEEAPARVKSPESARPCQLVCLSAKTDTALEVMTNNLAVFLRGNPSANLADVAFTLHAGRRRFNHVRIAVARNGADLADMLETKKRVITAFQKPKEQTVTFLFAGTGYVTESCLALYKAEPFFAQAFEECASCAAEADINLTKLLYADKPMENPRLNAVMLFAFAYALAKLWMRFGILPQRCAGDGVGQWVSACINQEVALAKALEHVRQGDSYGGKATALAELLAEENQILIAFGPREFLPDEYTRAQKQTGAVVIPILSNQYADPHESMLYAVGRYWLAYAKVDWNGFYAQEKRCRVALPTYPFERQRYWIEPARQDGGGTANVGFGGNPLRKRARPDMETPYEEPSDEIEKTIADKWQEVLGYDRIGIRDDFFELGGHSLIAAAVAADLSQKFDVQIPMRTLFEKTTIAEIAKLIQAYQWAGTGAAPDWEESQEMGSI